MSQPVDVVYTWVRGEDADYCKLVSQYSGRPSHKNPERYRDQLDLLRYSFRSLDMFFPDYRNLYLVTMRPQKPEWLNLQNSRIRLVHHDEFFGNKSVLPTFNHNTIESYLHLLPGLSENFVYMNDDFMFGKRVSIEDFFPSGKPRIFGSLLGEAWKSRIFDGGRLSFGIIEHCPVPIAKEIWAKMHEMAPDELELTRREKFRESHHLRMDRLYTYYALKYCRSRVEISRVWRTARHSRFIKIGNDLEQEKKSIHKLMHARRKFICLNDDQGDSPSLEVIKAYRSYLNQVYPSKSQYENK